MKIVPSKNDTIITAKCTFTGITCHVISINGNIIHLSFSQAKHGAAVRKMGDDCRLATCNHLPGRDISYDYLEDYFAGRSQTSAPQPHSPFIAQASLFQRKVWAAISTIPYGLTSTYGEIARQIDCEGGARAVGNACNANPLAIIIPCHRVIGQTGIGGFAGKITIKKKLLGLEKRTLAFNRSI